jgi:hypothetical protein
MHDVPGDISRKRMAIWAPLSWPCNLGNLCNFLVAVCSEPAASERMPGSGDLCPGLDRVVVVKLYLAA